MKISAIVFLVCLLGSCSSGPELIFEDTFEGTSLNTAYWNYDLGDGCPDLCGWGNNERQRYTKNNVQVADGLLTITANLKDSVYRSGRITTKNKVAFTYGTIEVRAKLPEGKGLWPAIWMLGSNIDSEKWPGCGEIDIMEYVGKEPHVIHTSVHTTASHGETINTKKTIHTNIENGFHVYKATWTKDAIQFFIDEKPVYTFSPENKTQDNWPFDKPFYVLVNMAIGGNFGGPAVDDAVFPAEFQIDYIKIYKS